MIDLIALITHGHQAGAAGDAVGVGVVWHGPHFAGEIGARDDVDAGHGHEQEVGGADDEGGETSLQCRNLRGFSDAVVVERFEHELPFGRGRNALRRLLGPGEDFEIGLELAGELGLGSDLLQALDAKLDDGIGAKSVPREYERRGGFEEVAETFGIARHEGVEEFFDLTKEERAFVNEIAAMSAQDLEVAILVGPNLFDESEAVSGGAEDGGEIGVVGFVAGIGGLTVLFGREGMHKSGVKARVTKSALDGAMIVAGHFDGDDAIAQLVLSAGLANAFDGRAKIIAVVLERGGRKKDLAIEVGEEIAGPRLGAIEGEDAEVLWADRLHAIGDDAIGLLEQKRLGIGTRLGPWHRNLLFGTRIDTSLNQKGDYSRAVRNFSYLAPIPR